MSAGAVTVQVRFFASLREAIGVERCQCDLPAPAGLRELFATLRTQFGDTAVAELQADNVRLAVNQSLLLSEDAFESGDEIAFLPPVTGG